MWSEGINAGLKADAVGRGDKFAVGDEADLVRAGDDPLSVGGGEVGAEPQDAGAEVSGGVESGGRCLQG